MFWVAGFDLLYSLQDIEVDKKLGLHSIPSKFGAKKNNANIKSLSWFDCIILVTFYSKFK